MTPSERQQAAAWAQQVLHTSMEASARMMAQALLDVTRWEYMPSAVTPPHDRPFLGYGRCTGEINGEDAQAVQAVVEYRDGTLYVVSTDAYAVWMELQAWMELPEDPR